MAELRAERDRIAAMLAERNRMATLLDRMTLHKPPQPQAMQQPPAMPAPPEAPVRPPPPPAAPGLQPPPEAEVVEGDKDDEDVEDDVVSGSVSTAESALFQSPPPSPSPPHEQSLPANEGSAKKLTGDEIETAREWCE